MSRSQIVNYLRPSSPDEALTLLRERGKSARFVGGGADVVLSLSSDVTILIDLFALNLSSIEERPDGIRIGATATLNEVLENQAVAGVCDGVISEMMSKVGSPLLRNLATIGGTLVSAHSWSDVIPLLLVLDAQVTVYNGEYRSLPLSDLYTERGQLTDSILTEVIIPSSVENDYAAFEKFNRTGYDVALLNCACFVHINAGHCHRARIAIGGTPRLATRIAAVEQALQGAQLTDEAIESAAQIARDTTEIADDRRASGKYRKQLVYAGIKRCLRQIAEKAEGGR